MLASQHNEHPSNNTESAEFVTEKLQLGVVRCQKNQRVHYVRCCARALWKG